MKGDAERVEYYRACLAVVASGVQKDPVAFAKKSLGITHAWQAVEIAVNRLESEKMHAATRASSGATEESPSASAASK